MRQVLLAALRGPIHLYRILLSPILGPRCRFHPSCSAYALQALEQHGPLRGLWLTARRLCSCHPWSPVSGHDPVPERFDWPVAFGYKRRRKP